MATGPAYITDFKDFTESPTEPYLKGPTSNRFDAVKKAQNAKLAKMGEQMAKDMEAAIWIVDNNDARMIIRGQWRDFIMVQEKYNAVPIWLVDKLCPEPHEPNMTQRQRFERLKRQLEPLDAYLATHAETPWRLASDMDARAHI